MSKTAFIGHRQLLADKLKERLFVAITTEIQNGCKQFIMGTHGEFDQLALNTCRKLRAVYGYIDIEVVITSLNSIRKSL